MQINPEIRCWICGEISIPIEKSNSLQFEELSSDQFKISDSEYGKSLPRYRCISCSFIQCDTPADMVSFYQTMNDDEYDLGENSRQRQFEDLLQKSEIKGSLKWLDVGCGTGMLVEIANKLGHQAIGIDPSVALIEKGVEKGRTVFCATLENYSPIDELFDVISLIDVIEHVDDPLLLIRLANQHLKPGGLVLLSTPDSSSLFARALKSRWWHVRVAHIGYFNKKTLQMTLEENGFVPLKWFRPNWYFESAYFAARLSKYLPIIPKNLMSRLLRNRLIRINLHDSWAIVSQKNA